MFNFSNMNQKRKRANNFTPSEKELLVDIISVFKDTIENKKTDARTLKEKEAVWKKVTIYFNSQSGTVRSIHCLKHCWDNMKRKCRKSFICSKDETQLDNADEFNEKVKNILYLSYDNNNACNEVNTEDGEWSDDEKNTIDKYEWPDEKSSEVSVAALGNNSNEWNAAFWSAALSKRPVTVSLKPTNLESDEEDSTPEGTSLPKGTVVTDTPYILIRDSPDCTSSIKGNIPDSPKPNLKESDQKTYWDEKRKYIALLSKHLIAEEKRKREMHALQVTEKKFKIELLKLEIDRVLR